MEKKEQNITIKIADVAPISMTIEPAKEERIREAEYNVNRVWSEWRRRFEDKTSKEILAMAAFQFAKLYYQLRQSVNDQQHLLDDFEADLDRMLALKPGKTAES